jgi:hypothetical protein
MKLELFLFWSKIIVKLVCELNYVSSFIWVIMISEISIISKQSSIILFLCRTSLVIKP